MAVIEQSIKVGRRINPLWAKGSMVFFFALFKSRYKHAGTGIWGVIILVVTCLISQLGHAAPTFGINKTCGGTLASAVSPGQLYVGTFEEARSAFQSLTLEAAAVVLIDHEYSHTTPNGTIYFTVRHTSAPTLDVCYGNSSINSYVCNGVSNCSGFMCAARRPNIVTATSSGGTTRTEGVSGGFLLCGIFSAEQSSACAIKLSGFPAEVEPGKEVQNLRADVMCDGVPTAKEVALIVRAENNSGGHNHTSGRPNGALSPNSGSSPLTFSFVAPAPAGDHVITAKCADNSCGEDTGRMWVGRKGLETLRNSQYYILVGDTPNHFDNHYLSPEAINQVYALTALYQIAKFPSDPLLHLNDASLERGGLFDVSSNWAPSHFEHCRGTEIDVRANDTLGAIPEWNYQIFERLAGQVGASAMFEIPRDKDGNALYGRRHFHVRMTGVRPQCP